MRNHAGYYNEFYRDVARIDEQHNSIAKIQDLIPPLREGAKILDIGSGHGSVSCSFVEMGYRVYGMDVNREAIESLKRKGITPIEHDLTQPLQLRDRFDLVLILDVLEHLFDPLGLLGEAAAVLGEDGRMIITVPLYFDLIDRLRILCTGGIVSYDNRYYGRELYRRFKSYTYDHVRFFQPRDVLQLCELQGLRVEQVRYRPMSAKCYGFLVNAVVKLIANRHTVNLNPGLLAHSMALRVARRA